MVGGVSRRELLELSGAAIGAGPVASSRFWKLESDQSGISGWVTKGRTSEIGGRAGVVESFRHSGSSLCNDGSVYRCRTCSGTEFYLLVPGGSLQPTVESTYRFGPTGETNVCGNFRVELLEAEPCEGSGSTTTETPSEPANRETDTETTTETTETTTEEPADDEPTTEESDAEEPATEESADDEPTTEESDADEPTEESADGEPTTEEPARGED